MSISCHQLVVQIGKKKILKSVSFSAIRGTFIGLIGPNGSGKSTWLKALGGLLSYQSGTIRIQNKKISSYSANQLAKMIGYVPQDTTIGFDFRVRDIVMMGRHSHIPRFGFGRFTDYERVNEAMERTAITHLSEQSVTSLSGGQRQMVFIAKALAQDPSILLLDEPTSALDLHRQLQVLELVRELVDEGMIAIAALHDLNMAARFCDQLVLLKNGEVQAAGEPKAVLTKKRLQESYHVETAIRHDELIHAQTVTALKYQPPEQEIINERKNGVG
ncbi:ABC transporter ATP-binding protein [Siminovitchia sp. FSL H7-0308]|uniref:ABC transporter ATP-binding protein n=1 Tax=unclassified Siminovitchia TaxID=2837530 RepID=UPI0030D4319B